MTLSRRSRRRWLIILWVSVLSAIISAWFGVRVAPAEEWWVRSAVHGAITSLVIATPLLFMMVMGNSWPLFRRLRRLPLPVYLAVRSGIYFFFIVGGLILVRVLLSEDVASYIKLSPLFRQSMIFSLVMALGLNLIFEIGGLLGLGTLGKLMTGRYVQPRAEMKTFLLIDMKNSTGLAERLGPIRFHELLNDFFRDIAHAALECDAEIHKYVGDEAILTWPDAAGLDDGAVLACAFLALDTIASQRSAYLARYGAVPEFRAALHRGEIVAGEIGDLRREIAYVGDTLNVAARLLDAAKQVGHDILASNDLLRSARLPAGIRATELPVLTIRGREAPLGVAALARG